MSMLDGLLGQITQNVDVANLAAKVGLDPAMAEKAIAALGAAHSAPEDTVSLAASQTGIDASILQPVVQHIGGDGSLGQFAQLLQGNSALSGLTGMLDRDGDGNPLNDVAGLAKGLFGS